jgi:hypothetical protein
MSYKVELGGQGWVEIPMPEDSERFPGIGFRYRMGLPLEEGADARAQEIYELYAQEHSSAVAAVIRGVQERRRLAGQTRQD